MPGSKARRRKVEEEQLSILESYLMIYRDRFIMKSTRVDRFEYCACYQNWKTFDLICFFLLNTNMKNLRSLWDGIRWVAETNFGTSGGHTSNAHTVKWLRLICIAIYVSIYLLGYIWVLLVVNGCYLVDAVCMYVLGVCVPAVLFIVLLLCRFLCLSCFFPCALSDAIKASKITCKFKSKPANIQ